MSIISFFGGAGLVALDAFYFSLGPTRPPDEPSDERYVFLTHAQYSDKGNLANVWV